jgi:hypothetical protein
MVAVLLCMVVLVDLLASTAVYYSRRDAAKAPPFATRDVGGVDWNVSPYAGLAALMGFSASPARPAVASASGHVTYQNQVNPAINATYVLAALDRAGANRDMVWVGRAETAMRQVLRASQHGLLPYPLENTDPYGDPLPVPGYSSETQGLVLSALARLYEVTEDQRWRRPADEIFEALQLYRGFFAGSLPAPEPWLSLVDAQGFLWFEQFTHGRAPIESVTAQLFSMVGIYDYRRILADRPAERRQATRLFAGGLATIDHYLPMVRQPGQLSLDSIAARSRSPRAHRTLEAQLTILGRLTGRSDFGRLSRLLDRDDDLPPFNTTRVRIGSNVEAYSRLPSGYGFATNPKPPAELTPSGLVTVPPGVVDPSGTARYILVTLERYEATGRRPLLGAAESAAEAALAGSSHALLQYRYRQTDALGAAMPIPWYSAEGQGLMLGAVTRIAVMTGSPTWRHEARKVFATLMRFRDHGVDGQPPPRPWVSLVDDSGYLWFEQFPSGAPPSVTMHVHLSTLLAVYDYWKLTADPLARQMFVGGTTTVKHYLPVVRKVGRASFDSMASRAADETFQPLIDTQLAILARITGDRQLTRYPSS